MDKKTILIIGTADTKSDEILQNVTTYQYGSKNLSNK